MDETTKQALLTLSGVIGSGALWAGLKVFMDFISKHREYKGARVKPWRELLSAGQWRTAAPCLLEATFADAHGFPLGDREIRFGLSRHNSTEFFRRLAHCRAIIEVDEGGSGLHHRRGFKVNRWSYRAHSIMAAVAGVVPLVFLAPLAKPLSHLLPGAVIGWMFVYAGVWLMMMVVATQQYEAAHVLVSRLDRRFPRWAGAESENINAESPSTNVAHLAQPGRWLG